MPVELDRLLAGISTYQDVVVAGQTVRRGARDCEGRWQAIAPHLPVAGVLLDVGANFCWFSLRWCAEGSQRIAIALEADYRSAAVARHALASHDDRRVALCTAAAGAATARRLAASGRRIDAALCLSVLHWIPDHREFLAELGRVADRIFIEQPHADETGAGVTAIRDAIGAIGPYLQALFPDRPVQHLASWNAHRTDELPRELWLVGPPDAAASPSSPAVDVAALCELEVAWPPRSWWQRQLSDVGRTASGFGFTPHGVVAAADFVTRTPDEWRRAVAAIPEQQVTTWRRRARRIRLALWKRIRSWITTT